MSALSITLIATLFIFGGALAGLWLQGRLPRHHLDEDSREIVKLGAGVIATITALVLGLLVSSAKTTFDDVNAGIKQGSAKTILLDRLLAQYGPEAQSVREHLKRSVLASLESTQASRPANPLAQPATPLTNRVEAIQARLRGLTPRTDDQRQLLSQAQQLAADVAQARWLLLEQAQSELPFPLLAILVFWLSVLFMCFGLLAPRNATVLGLLFVCTCSMAAAIFLLLELNHPLDGFIRISQAPLLNLSQCLGR